MPEPVLQTSIGFEGASVQIMARIYGNAGTVITQATISSVLVRVYDMADSAATYTLTASPTVASTVYDTLQTDARWTEDSTGYNFLYAIAGTAFPDPRTTYQIQITLTPTSGNEIRVAHQHTTLEWRGE